MSLRADRRIAAVVLCTVFLFAAGLLMPQRPALADAASEARRAIQAAYDGMDAAIVRKEEKGAFAFHAPDHVATFRDQEVTLAQSRRALADLLDGARYIRSTTTIENFTLREGGKEALVTAKGYFKASIYDAATDGRVLLAMTAYTRDTWVRSGKGSGSGGRRWLLKRSRVLSMNVTRNGKPVPVL